MILGFNALLNQILFNFVTCNYATNVTQKIYSVSDLVYNVQWYRFPTNEQRLLILIIKRAQKIILLDGYGIITCSMITFLQVSTQYL